MNIKRIVRLSFIVIAILIFFIFITNKVMLFQFKENNMIKDDITTLLLTQENMNNLIQDISKADTKDELKKLKKSFFNYEKIFEDKVYTVSTILFLMLMVFIIILSYKVNKLEILLKISKIEC